MSANLQMTLTSLFDSKVPEIWLRVSWLSPTLGFWFSDVINRSQQLQEWLAKGRPKTYWLTGFFNPNGFLTAMRQEITRAHGWALDTVALTTEVTKYREREEVKSLPEEGVYVHGLFIDGASWEQQDMRLIDSAPKVLFFPLNVVWVSATNTAQAKDATTYVCPCYKVPKRTGLNYIFDIDLSTRPAREVDSAWCGTSELETMRSIFSLFLSFFLSIFSFFYHFFFYIFIIFHFLHFTPLLFF
jgi:dynein heavy chain